MRWSAAPNGDLVMLELGDEALLGTCTCPFFNDHLEPCKHLWAVALTCDARGALQPPDTLPAAALDFVAVPLDDEANGGKTGHWTTPNFDCRVRTRRARATDACPAGSRPSPPSPPHHRRRATLLARGPRASCSTSSTWRPRG